MIDRASQLQRRLEANAEAANRPATDLAEMLDACGLPNEWDTYWRRVVFFFNRRWFGQAWILQEAVLARMLELFCGRYVILWHNLVGSSRFINEHLRQLTVYYVSISKIGDSIRATPPLLNRLRRDDFWP